MSHLRGKQALTLIDGRLVEMSKGAVLGGEHTSLFHLQWLSRYLLGMSEW